MEEIWMDGDFTIEKALKVRSQILERAEIDKSLPVLIFINSYGGEVDALTCLLDTLDNIPNPVFTVCVGTAQSAGAVLLARGDKAYIGANSSVMIHKAKTIVRGSDDDFELAAKDLKRLNDIMVEYIAKKTKKTKKTINTLLAKNVDINMGAKEALEFGIVDVIGIPRMVEKSIFYLEEPK